MKTERLAALALMHASRDVAIDVETVILEFCAKRTDVLLSNFFEFHRDFSYVCN